MPNHIDPTPGNAGYEGAGPASIQGVEASDLPDKGRGPVETNIGKEMSRKAPQNLGGNTQEEGGDVGLRATPDAADAADHGGHGRNVGT